MNLRSDLDTRYEPLEVLIPHPDASATCLGSYTVRVIGPVNTDAFPWQALEAKKAGTVGSDTLMLPITRILDRDDPEFALGSPAIAFGDLVSTIRVETYGNSKGINTVFTDEFQTED